MFNKKEIKQLENKVNLLSKYLDEAMDKIGRISTALEIKDRRENLGEVFGINVDADGQYYSQKIKKLNEEVDSLKEILKIRSREFLPPYKDESEIGIIIDAKQDLTSKFNSMLIETDKRIEKLYDHFNLKYSTEEKGVVKKDKEDK